MDWELILKFIGTEFIVPLGVIATAYFGYFRAKFKKYGDIEAQLQKLDVLSTIKQTLAEVNKIGEIEGQLQKLDELALIKETLTKVQKETELIVNFEHKELIAQVEGVIARSKNSNEFEYWKRKEDSDRLENFAFMISDATTQLRGSSDDAFYLMLDMRRYLQNHTPKETIIKHGSTYAKLNYSMLEKVTILFNIYFREYNCEDFNEKFFDWTEKMLDYYALNCDHSTTISNFSVAHGDNSKKVVQLLSDVINTRNEECSLFLPKLLNATREVLICINILSKKIREEDSAKSSA